MGKSVMKEWESKKKLEMLEEWRAGGMKYGEMAELVGITERAFFNWRANSEPIRNATRTGTKTVVQELRQSLLQKAMGYTRTESKPFVLTTTKELAGKGKITESRVEMVDVVVYYPPDTNAIKFALSNITQTDTGSDEDGIVWRLVDRAGLAEKPEPVEIVLRREP